MMSEKKELRENVLMINSDILPKLIFCKKAR